MATGWAIDLGTTNTAVARWDPSAGRPMLMTLPALCRRPDGDNPLEAPRLVPSATHVCERLALADRLGRLPLVETLAFVGRQAWIGRPALEMNAAAPRPAFAPTFKPFLARESQRTLVRARGRAYSAREVAQLYVRELLAELKRATGERIRELTLTTPVEAYETYRAELQRIFERLGVRRLRFIDEPVAAALGYDLTLDRERRILVLDFGGGTLHLALLALGPDEARGGLCRVIAKEGSAIGGRLVDRWLLAELCRRLGCPLADPGEEPAGPAEEFWLRLMLAEACRVKEALFFRESESFVLTVPDRLRGLGPASEAPVSTLEVGRDDLVRVLEGNGLYDQLRLMIEAVAERARQSAIALEDVDDVLMVGGSSLLPGVYSLFEERFGRGRVRAWQPFEAVAYGAAAFAAGRFGQSDFIVHDYAFVTHDPATLEPQYTVIVPRGTRVPTAPDFWKCQLVPTCSLGEPETFFKLVICEIGRAPRDERAFVWDAAGRMHKLGGRESAEEQLVVPLNEANPTLGYLQPPHSPGDHRPRLEIAFGVNAERWLIATVRDLRTATVLMREEPVVRLM